MQNQKLYLLSLFITIFTSHSTLAARFNFNNFDGSNLVFLGDAELGSTSDGSSLSGALSMTRDNSPFSHGLALYTEQIPFKPSNSSSLYSFKTSFTFSISPHRKTNPNPGHGLAFIVVPTIDNDGSSGLGFLGLLNRTNNGSPNNHVFAVEFDVFQDKDLGDINDNHVGIDINSVKSTVSEKAGYWVQTRSSASGKKEWEFKELKLSSGEKYKSWIEYNDVNKVVTVTIAPAYLSKPKKPLIENQIDLSTVLFDKMFTGFAGSMGRDIERHDIWTWRFENNAPKDTKPVQSG